MTSIVPGNGAAYAERGILYTSWLDGNIRTIEKDWVQVESTRLP